MYFFNKESVKVLLRRQYTYFQYGVSIHLLFIVYESPQVQLKVVTVCLNLLQSKPTKRSQTNTLEQSLKKNIP